MRNFFPLCVATLALGNALTQMPVFGQTNPVYACWKLTFSSSGVMYENILQMNGYRGRMLTTYYDQNVGRTAFVEQTMKLTSSAKGMLILGYSPVYAGTTRRHPTYSADNFLFQVRPSGEYLFATCDDGGRCSPVDVESCPR